MTSHRWSWKRHKRVHRRLTQLTARTVIFNQNCYLTFRKHSWNDLSRPTLYQRPHTVAAIVVSEDSHRYLRTAFPNLRLFRIRNAIDSDRFYPIGTKKPQIAFMPRKNAQDLVQVLKILHLRGSLDGFRLAPIDGMSEKQVAHTLQESAIFLSFGYPEGFGLPPAEAMACGCFVVGYHGQGGREFFRPEFSCPIDTGDITAYVQAVEAALAQWRDSPETIREKGRQASQFIRTVYSPENERQDVLAVWNCLLAGQTTDPIGRLETQPASAQPRNAA
ncbi:MAG: glycosyltransferase [Planctomycetes bacterium]|nr:glycosyltransferase [Planctomycetota bacterium]